MGDELVQTVPLVETPGGDPLGCILLGSKPPEKGAPAAMRLKFSGAILRPVNKPPTVPVAKMNTFGSNLTAGQQATDRTSGKDEYYDGHDDDDEDHHCLGEDRAYPFSRTLKTPKTLQPPRQTNLLEWLY